MKILFLSRWFPYPADNGSKLRIYNLIRQLSREHSVDLISFASEEVQEEQLQALGEICRSVKWVQYRPFQPDRLRALLGFFSWKPRAVVDTFNDELDRLARTAASVEAYDVVIASQIDMAVYAARLPVKVRVLEEMEVTTVYDRYKHQPRPWKRIRAALTWEKLAVYLHRLFRDFDGVTVVSEIERERLAELTPAFHNVRVVSNGVDCQYLSGDFGRPEPLSLVYTGALTYKANFDAMEYFLAEIFPLIRAGCPGVKLYITGSTRGVTLESLSLSDDVILTGYLNDIRPRVSQSWLQVVPLRVGGGTRLKILESLALGTPVVATSKGAEGLNLQPGEDILVADSPQDFADAVVNLLHDARLRDRLAQQGRSTVCDGFDWSAIGADFIGWMDELVEGSGDTNGSA